jgi:hypothetical protein
MTPRITNSSARINELKRVVQASTLSSTWMK